MQDAIIDEPERDWSMAALAQAGHTTERHLLRLFIEHARVSPLQYLRAIRLERARQALEHGASVTRAAEVAGFRSDFSCGGRGAGSGEDRRGMYCGWIEARPLAQPTTVQPPTDVRQWDVRREPARQVGQ